MITKRRINEDFDQRLNYLMKQYGKGWLVSDSGFVTLMKDDEEIDDFDWDNSNDRIAYITMDRKGISNDKNWERVSKPQINEISDKIITMVWEDTKKHFAKNVPLRFIANKIFVLGDCVTIHIPVDVKNFYSPEDIAYPDDIIYNPNGNYTMSVCYTFKLNDRLVKGEFLSLLTDFELVR